MQEHVCHEGNVFQRHRNLKTRYSFATIQQEKWEVGLELSNATSSIGWIFVPLFDEAHNPEVGGSNPTPATSCLRSGPETWVTERT